VVAAPFGELPKIEKKKKFGYFFCCSCSSFSLLSIGENILDLDKNSTIGEFSKNITPTFKLQIFLKGRKNCRCIKTQSSKIKIANTLRCNVLKILEYTKLIAFNL